MKASKRHRDGDWNTLDQETLADGSVVVRFHRVGEDKAHRIRMDKDGNVLEDEDIN